VTRSITLMAVVLLVGLPSANGQVEACLGAVRTASSGVGVWTSIKQYFRSLTEDKTTVDRARLTTLRARLVDLEAEKLNLIALVESHLVSQSAGAAVSKQISLQTVPDILQRIETITGQLDQEAREGDRFVGEPAFKQLKIQLDLKRTTTLCQISQEVTASTPAAREALQSLLKQLKDELDAISSAEEQLAAFIRKP
jgi:hypothetical protein